jgi:hypothetical protein
MKKILIILFLIAFSLIVLSNKIEGSISQNIDISIKGEEVGIIFSKQGDNEFILLKTSKSVIFLPVSEPDGNELKVIRKLGIKKLDYSYSRSIKAKQFLDYKNQLQIENIKIYKEGENTIIDLGEEKFCIYKEGKLPKLSYIFFVNEGKINNDSIKLSFYSENVSEEFEKVLYKRWIDIYKVRKAEFTFVKFSGEDYNVVRIPN